MLVARPILLSKFVADHDSNDDFYGLAAMFLIPLFYWAGTLYFEGLKYRLASVWFSYSFVLVIMMGVIFGRAVIEDNKLREHEIATCLCNVTNITESQSFFDSKFLKITLCFTPGIMLLLLTSVTDETETLKQLYFTSVMDLFDGVEMIEVLHEDICDKIPMGWEIAVLVAALLFFLSSFLEIYQVKFNDVDQSEKAEQQDEAKKQDKVKFCKKRAMVNTCFQIVLNPTFLVIRAVLWLHYDFDSAVFLAKNLIAIVIALVDVLEARGCIITTADEGNNEITEVEPMEQLGVDNLHDE